MLTILNKHWWENFKNTAEMILGTCATCEQYNLGKTVKVRHGQEPYEHLPAPTLHGIYLFLGWVTAFPC